jgi:myo-inositol-1-phosphate synthase
LGSKEAVAMAEVRVAIVGVGNCASALVQGIEYYKDAQEQDRVPGLMHVKIGPYHISDIKVVAAFDVDENKVGKDLGEAVFAEPNNTYMFAEVPPRGVEVVRGPTLDGLGKYYRETISESSEPIVDVSEMLMETEADVLINYLPVGSEDATRFYVSEALEAGCGVVNCIPVFIANEEMWQGKFRRAGVPIVGDDIKSQVGATIVHRVLARLFNDRGVELERTSQLNIGGNMDFKNMLERERLESKKISKTNAVVSQLDHNIDSGCVHIGPSDYVSWLTDRKWAYIRCEGKAFGDAPLNMEFKLEVWDSPNSAGIVIDALRCCKLAMDRGMAGALIGPAAYFMKSPPVQFSDSEARDMVESFIRGEDLGILTTAELGNGRDLEDIRNSVPE